MAIVKINEKTLVQKLKVLLLGPKKPSLFIRISVIIGFGIWLYFAIWQVLIFLSIVLRSRLRNPKIIEQTFEKIGRQFGFMHRWGLETIQILTLHSIVVLIFYAFSLLSLVFIYRQKKIGPILFAISNGLVMLFTYVFLGQQYIMTQISLFDIILFLTFTIYFLAGLLIFKKNN